MNDVDLRRRWRDVAQRYAQLVGTPPPMPRDRGEMAVVANQMLAALVGRRDASAGPPVAVGTVDIHVQRDGGAALVTVLDAEGRIADTRRVGLSAADVQALVEKVAATVLEPAP